MVLLAARLRLLAMVTAEPLLTVLRMATPAVLGKPMALPVRLKSPAAEASAGPVAGSADPEWMRGRQQS